MVGLKSLSTVLLCGTAFFSFTGERCQSVVIPYTSVKSGDAEVLYGGYGSDLAYDAADSTYWLLTDRGPNVDGPTKESKVFLNPGFNPHIGVFKLQGDSLVRVRTVRLCEADGTPFTGLPERIGDGTTGEFAFDMSGHSLDGNRRGIDPEGLALDTDGTFWVSDEYGPYLMHFSKDGRLLRKLSPLNGGLPGRYAQRCPNRGLEGLCMRKSTGAIYGMLQSPLQGSKERVLPLFEMDRSGQVRDFDYPLSEEAQGVSAICALGDSSLLVLERDGKFPKDGKGFKRIFKVDIPACGAGLLKKRLVVDVLAACPGYDYDKIEGMAVVEDSVICISNDDDFGVTTENQRVVTKLKPDGTPDHSTLTFIPVANL